MTTRHKSLAWIDMTCNGKRPAEGTREGASSGTKHAYGPTTQLQDTRLTFDRGLKFGREQALFTRCTRIKRETGHSNGRRCKICSLSQLYIHPLRTARLGYKSDRWHGSAAQASYASVRASPFSDCARPQFSMRCLERGLWVHLSVTVYVHGRAGAYSQA